jgi:outer membrane protein OmpA-like peptidoglycan-associated protein
MHRGRITAVFVLSAFLIFASVSFMPALTLAADTSNSPSNSSTPINANTDCPAPNPAAHTLYDSTRKEKQWQVCDALLKNCVTYTNLYGTSCPTTIPGVEGVTVNGQCQGHSDCKAISYSCKGVDGKTITVPVGTAQLSGCVIPGMAAAPANPVSGTGVNIPLPQSLPQQTLQQISSAFQNGTAPMAEPYTVSPTGQLETLTQSAASPSTPDNQTQSFNYLGPSASVSDLSNPASPVNAAINAISPTPNPVFTAQSGFGSSDQASADQTSSCTGGTWSCWLSQTWNSITNGSAFSMAAQAGTDKTDAQVIAEQGGNTAPFSTPLSSGTFGPTVAAAPEQQPSQLGPTAVVAAGGGQEIPVETSQPVAGSGQPVAPSGVSLSAGPLNPQTSPVVAGGTNSAADTGSVPAVSQISPANQLAQDQEMAARIAAAPASLTSSVPTPIPPTTKLVQQVLSEDWAGASKTLATIFAPQPSALEAVPVTPAEQADLPPLPGTPPDNSTPSIQTLSDAGTPPSAATPPASALLTDAQIAALVPVPDGVLTTPQSVDPLTQSVIDQKLQTAQASQQYLQNLVDNSQSPTAKAVAQTLLDEANQRVNTIVNNAIDIYTGNPSPTVQSAIGQANQGQGVLSGALMTNADQAYSLANNLGSSISTSDMSLADVAKGAGWLAAETWGTVNSAVANLGGTMGVAGFNPDPATAIGNAIDPYGSDYKTLSDVIAVAPFGIGAAKMAGGAVLDTVLGSSESAMWSALPKSVTNDVLFSDSAGFTTPVSQVAVDAIAPSVESGAIVPADAAAAGPSAMNNLASNINAELSGTQRAVGSLGQLPKSGTIFDTAPSASEPYAAIDSAVADMKTAVMNGPGAPLVAAETSATIPAAATAGESVAPSGSLADVSAGSNPSLDQSAWEQAKGGWTGGALVGGGIACSLFSCFASDTQIPPQDISVDVISAADIPNLPPFPGQSTGPSTVADAGPAVPAAESAPSAPPEPLPAPQAPVEPAPSDISPQSVLPNPAEPAAPSASISPPTPASESVLSSPVSSADTAPTPQAGMAVSTDNLKQQQQAVDAQVQAVKVANQMSLDAFDTQQKAQSTQTLADAIAQAQANLDAAKSAAQAVVAQPPLLPAAVIPSDTSTQQVNSDLPLPVVAPQSATTADTSGGQGSGPVTSADIMQGLAPAPGGGGGNKVSLDINFVSGSAVLTPEGSAAVAQLAGAMSSSDLQNSTFTIVGHTDTVIPSNGLTNQTLSEMRAQTIVNTLSSLYGIPASQMTAIGVGDTQPKVNIQGDVAANRRVEIIATTPGK